MSWLRGLWYISLYSGVKRSQLPSRQTPVQLLCVTTEDGLVGDLRGHLLAGLLLEQVPELVGDLLVVLHVFGVHAGLALGTLEGLIDIIFARHDDDLLAI